MIAKILRIKKREMPYVKPESYKEQDISTFVSRLASKAKQLRDLKKDLEQLPIETLRQYVTTSEEHRDQRGRLHNERSGEGPRQYGQSEIERIIAAQDRADQQDTTVEDGTTPTGVGGVGNVDDSELHADPDYRRGERMPAEYRQYLEEYDTLISDAAKEFIDETPDGLRCRFCGTHVADIAASIEHFWREYERGWEMTEKITTFATTLGNDHELTADARQNLIKWPHFQVIERRRREQLRQKRQNKPRWKSVPRDQWPGVTKTTAESPSSPAKS